MSAEIGHNVGGVNAGQLRSLIERLDKLEDDATAIREDKADVYKEASGAGFDKKALRKIIIMKRTDRDKRRADEEILDLYLNALGMVD